MPSVVPASCPLLADLLDGMRNPKFDIWTRVLAAKTILRWYPEEHQQQPALTYRIADMSDIGLPPKPRQRLRTSPVIGGINGRANLPLRGRPANRPAP
jgi:hypothetical protein